MRVNDPNAAGITSSGLSQAQRLEEVAGRRTGDVGRTGSNAEDRVQLSDLAGSLQELSADSPEREQLVERLAAEYRDGRYRADPGETSRAIIADAMKPNDL